MTSKALKWIAIITMTIDHIGLYLVGPDKPVLYLVLRGIGRLAFPLFAFFIAEGFRHTRDVNKYFLRLLSFALIVQLFLTVFYLLTKNTDGFAFSENIMITGNVFWPLVFGLLAVMLINERKTALSIIGFSLVIVADLIGFPYGGYGVAMILIFAFIPQKSIQFLYAVIVNLIYIEYPILFLIPGFTTKYDNPVQWVAILSFIPIFLYNGKLGKVNKYFFYLYYPIHLGVIFGISLLIR